MVPQRPKGMSALMSAIEGKAEVRAQSRSGASDPYATSGSEHRYGTLWPSNEEPPYQISAPNHGCRHSIGPGPDIRFHPTSFGPSRVVPPSIGGGAPVAEMPS